MEDMLAEARAYAVSLCLVHQNLAQLGRELREGISANARNKIIFTVSPEDARALERHVTPSLSGHDLAHLGAFQAAARLVVGAAEQPAFTMRTLPLPPPIPGRAEAIRAAARASAGTRSRPAPPASGGAAGDPRLNPGGTP
jgi:DNA helicase HerA-like ATPase